MIADKYSEMVDNLGLGDLVKDRKKTKKARDMMDDEGTGIINDEVYDREGKGFDSDDEEILR